MEINCLQQCFLSVQPYRKAAASVNEEAPHQHFKLTAVFQVVSIQCCSVCMHVTVYVSMYACMYGVMEASLGTIHAKSALTCMWGKYSCV